MSKEAGGKMVHFLKMMRVEGSNLVTRQNGAISEDDEGRGK